MAAVIPPAIAPRVGALLRLLGSDVDGEALGAARALRRTLGGVGLDLNDLGDAISRPAMIVPDAPEPKPRRGRKPRAGDIDLDFAQRRNVVEALRRGLAGGRLSEWEETFAASILARLQDGRGRLTGKQGDALGRLLARLGEGAAWV